MKKKNFRLLVSSAAFLGVVAFLCKVSFVDVLSALAEPTEVQSCASIVFGEGTVDDGGKALTSSGYTSNPGDLEFSLTAAEKIFSAGVGNPARFGSSAAGSQGTLAFSLVSSRITRIRLYAYQYKSDGAAVVTLQTSASTSQTATVTSSSLPDLSALSGESIYLFDHLDNGNGDASTSFTITSDGTNRFFLAKILLTIQGSGSPATSSSSQTSSSVPTSSSSTTSSSSQTSSSVPTSSSSSEASALQKSLTSSTQTSAQYSTGNYGTVSVDSTGYGYYRSYQDSGTLARLIAPSYGGEIPGSFYNIDPIKQITSITLDYKTASSSDSGAKFYAGSSSLLTSGLSLAAKTSQTSKTFTYDPSANIAYFRVDGGTSDLTIYSLDISYLGGGNSSLDYGSSGASLSRINPVVYSGTPVSGSSTVDVPSTLTQNGSSYVVTSHKTYTYYTYADVAANSSLASLAAYTDPADIAAYFIAFKTYPANFVSSGNYSSAKTIFGSATRCVSSYTRTDGYVNAVPYNPSGSSIATYYECDVALDSSYSSSSRGVGRVVVFSGGFSVTKGANGYDSSYVAVFTDDHYATFQEYYNFGSTFSHRFDAELFRTSYLWGVPTTLSA